MKNAKILIVDDDPDIVDQLTLVLSSADYEVATANGIEAAEQTLLSFHPDIAVIDLMMEHHDSGFVLSHEIKRLYPGTPVILLTAVKAQSGISFEPGSEAQAAWVKVDRILDKPVRPEQLKKEIAALLSHAEHSGDT